MSDKDVIAIPKKMPKPATQRRLTQPIISIRQESYEKLRAIKKATGQSIVDIVAMLVDRAVVGK